MALTLHARPMDALPPAFRWFLPPKLATPQATQRARAFWLLSWPFFAVVTVVLGLAVAVEPETLARRAVTIGAVGILVAALHELNRRGRTMFASWSLVLGLTIIVTQRAWITGGIHAPVPVFYTLFVVMAGALLGRRGGVIATAFCLACGAFLAGAELVGWLQPPADGRSPLPLFVFLVLVVCLALVVQTFLAAATKAVVASKSTGASWLPRVMPVEIGRFEPLRGRRSPTDVVELTRSVAGVLAALDPRRRLEVIADDPVVCQCDSDLLRRILDNIVGNAMRHTPAQGTVRVRVSGANDRVRIAVYDEGPGLPPHVRREVFEAPRGNGAPFAKPSHSAGLGLAFCKLAIESYGGSIRVEDNVPLGSVFVVELPR